ncbi:MAG: lytic murein transglycosylase B [Gammaproteobacteria bacterium]|nr:lytic murein transglycosylase B [Gammaproteobacteria bacterium]
MLLRHLIFAFVFLYVLSTASWAGQQPFSQRPDVQQFIQMMVVKHHFSESKLDNLFSRVYTNQQVLDLMEKPLEHKPWYFYRKLFITDKHVQEGVRFWRKNARALHDAERIYGVPASIIVAIIGVETSYGDNRGNVRTLDALSTLAFDYPQRAKFFRGELEQFLLLTRELAKNPMNLYGSYAGALGYPQFMPSSYRKYGVDFNKNNHADLLDDPVDAIGSVANYLKMKGWQPHQPITERARVVGTGYQALGRNAPPRSLKLLTKDGVYATKPHPSSMRAGFLTLDGESVPEYWLVFHNFYVIKAYNSSSLYAMSVYQLSQLLEKKRRH